MDKNLHYKQGTIEPIEYILANDLPFCEGNCVKYITRHKHKGGSADVLKMIDYGIYILKSQYGINVKLINENNENENKD